MFCRILFRWRWSIPKVIWLWGIHTWEWIILPFNTISIIHILWGWTSINPNDVYVNQGIRVLICPLLLKAKAKEAAAALLPDVAATSEGFHDLSGGPTQWGLEGVWKGFLCCFLEKIGCFYGLKNGNTLFWFYNFTPNIYPATPPTPSLHLPLKMNCSAWLISSPMLVLVWNRLQAFGRDWDLVQHEIPGCLVSLSI